MRCSTRARGAIGRATLPARLPPGRSRREQLDCQGADVCLTADDRRSMMDDKTRFRLAAISFTVGEVRRGHPEGTRAPPHLPNGGGLGQLRRPKPPPKSEKFARTLSKRPSPIIYRPWSVHGASLFSCPVHL